MPSVGHLSQLSQSIGFLDGHTRYVSEQGALRGERFLDSCAHAVDSLWKTPTCSRSAGFYV
jgi:hypothetical protein